MEHWHVYQVHTVEQAGATSNAPLTASVLLALVGQPTPWLSDGLPILPASAEAGGYIQ